ncbi:hypothetical protein TELCIR_00537 [Teladorsagia circumcincta]|uniref:Gamma-glutamyltranspeptidase n=1 Tax=Teladorsagia circumcincta TaxID=45464 RepID=A0A2G9V4C0_TELCI|nr:hypothetical protein TELCIR_00537 [Teladorsagia circumcincta]
MYRPPEDIKELRAEGLPWVVATCLVVILVLAGLLFYYVSAENLTEAPSTTPAVAFLNYQAETSESGRFSIESMYDAQNSATLPLATGNIPLEWVRPHHSTSRTFSRAAVSSRNEYCAEIGRDVLIRGGNAVDAAIGTVICEGGLRPHATGFGGGLVMLLHDRNKNETIVISAYSAAPRSATEETFIVNPALAEIGTPASSDFVDAVKSRNNEIMSEKSMNAAYNVNLAEGQLFCDPIHAAFLRRFAIARDPVELFYRGDIANQIVHEMKQRGDLDYMFNDPTVRAGPLRNNTIETSGEVKNVDMRNLMWNLKDQSSVGSHINVVDGNNLAVALSSSLNER